MNRRHRLRSRAAFLAVREQRAASSTASLRVAVGANGGRAARVGYAIPRAVGGAVVRNRVRRRLREGLRARLDTIEGLDVVVSVRASAAGLTSAQLTAEMSRCIASAVDRLPEHARSARSARP